MKVLNIAIWSIGRHATNRIIPELLELNNIKLIGICSRNTSTIKKYVRKIGCIGWANQNEMLNCKRVDIIFIASPIGLHYEHAKKALKSGKHVWCEKPLTSSYSNTIELIEIAQKKNLILKECFMSIYHPQFKFLQQFVKDNIKNGIKSLVCRFGMPFLNEPGFRTNPKLCGGAIWDLGSHTVATAIELFPNQEVDVLFSEINFGENNIDYDGRAILRFSKGTSAYLEWGFGSSYKNDIDIWANKNSIYTDKIFSKPSDFKPKFLISNENGVIKLKNGIISNQFKNMFMNFYKSHSLNENKKNEDVNIAKRAKIMDQIIKISKKSNLSKKHKSYELL